MLIGMVALSNDVLDYATGWLGITGVWLVVLKMLDMATAAALFGWAFARGVEKFSDIKKAKRIWKWVFAWIIELIPILGELTPMWTITVLLAHREHRKAYALAERGRIKERQ